ncbi:MAG: HEPN domain-containing protein [Propionibacteriaceae bacterium]|jgi:2-C-methyl-D-erythritol 4-phosphate cytidylyltransferase|nr:HEPN domain-containing protein [Propionibacteriaceae bacterium]
MNDTPVSLPRWEQGRASIEAMIADARLTQVQASSDLALQYIATARTRLEGVALIRQHDPAGAFVLTYDAARLALAAVLINQGLRPRGEGAHAILLETVLAQTEPPRQREFREFTWMRKLRNDTQYPDADRLTATEDDLAQAIPAASTIVERAAILIGHMPAF